MSLCIEISGPEANKLAQEIESTFSDLASLQPKNAPASGREPMRSDGPLIVSSLSLAFTAWNASQSPEGLALRRLIRIKVQKVVEVCPAIWPRQHSIEIDGRSPPR